MTYVIILPSSEKLKFARSGPFLTTYHVFPDNIACFVFSLLCSGIPFRYLCMVPKISHYSRDVNVFFQNVPKNHLFLSFEFFLQATYTLLIKYNKNMTIPVIIICVEKANIGGKQIIIIHALR